MTARTSPAASIPTPSGGPEKSGVARMDSGVHVSSMRTNGTSTKMPHRPYTIEGMAASSSVRKISGERRIGGEKAQTQTERRSTDGRAGTIATYHAYHM